MLRNIIYLLSSVNKYHMHLISGHSKKYISLLAYSKNSRYCANTIMSDGGVFCLDDYNIIGFDLDNTLALYNLPEMINLEYDVLAKYLVKHKNYPEEILKPIGDDIDFLQRGLFLDAKRGNILKVSNDGIILRATHGTKLLINEEIDEIYGTERKWDLILQFIDDPLSTWNGPASEELRSFLDYFDIPATLLIARCVDAIDTKQKHMLKKEPYNIWPDLLDGLNHIYRREAFTEGTSEFFEAMKSFPEKYITKTSSKIIESLKELKKTKSTFLLTGSNIDFSECVASYALGSNWKSLFDAVVTYARKPGFFTQLRPFYEIEGLKEKSQIESNNLKLNNVYGQGNWKGLRSLLKQKFNIKNPRSLYIGDNLIQDIYTPSKRTDCDTISVVSEINEDHKNENDIQTKMISSKFWGSFFGVGNKSTIWTDIILNHSKLCIPNIYSLLKNSSTLSQKYECFDNSDSTNFKGFYPSKPSIFRKTNILNN